MVPKVPGGVGGAPEDAGPFGSSTITAVTCPEVLRAVRHKVGGKAAKKAPPAMASPTASNGSAVATIRQSASRFVVGIVGLLSRLSGSLLLDRFSSAASPRHDLTRRERRGCSDRILELAVLRDREPRDRHRDDQEPPDGPRHADREIAQRDRKRGRARRLVAHVAGARQCLEAELGQDRKSTRLNSSH